MGQRAGAARRVTGLRRPSIVWLGLALLIAPLGCAGTPGRATSPRPLWIEEFRSDLGTIGVRATHIVPDMAFQHSTDGKATGSLKGASAGLAASLNAALANPSGGVLFIAAAPLFAAGGALIGAAIAESAASVEQAASTLQRAGTALDTHGRLRDMVLDVARRETRHALASLPDASASSDGGRAQAASEGTDTILDVGLLSVQIVPGQGIDPPVPVMVRAHARLVHAASGAVIRARAFAYRSRVRTFGEWAADDARLLRDEMDRANRVLAETIVDDMFLRVHLGRIK